MRVFWVFPQINEGAKLGFYQAEKKKKKRTIYDCARGPVREVERLIHLSRSSPRMIPLLPLHFIASLGRVPVSHLNRPSPPFAFSLSP